MSGLEQTVLHAALIAAIRPIAAMLLRFGVGYREFADACKTAFVEMASEQASVGGRPANASRVALMTGLSRKEVKAVRDCQETVGATKVLLTHLPGEVLRQWFTSPLYRDADGLPKRLAWDSEESSFVELVRSCGTYLSPVAMRAELLRIGAVRHDENGNLVALRRYLIADNAKDLLAEGIQFGIRPLALTVARNVTAVDPRARRFQRIVDSYSVPLERRLGLEQEISARLKQFSEELDDLLAEVGEPSAEGAMSAVGIGLFYFEDEDDN